MLLPCLEPFSLLRPLGGDLEVTGDLYLDTALHADIAAVLQALRVLASSSVDLSSLSVQGKGGPCRSWGSWPCLQTKTCVLPPQEPGCPCRCTPSPSSSPTGASVSASWTRSLRSTGGSPETWERR